MKQYAYWIPVLILGIALGLFGCTKYDNGPRVSFRTELNRISGTWKVREALLNNVDVTDRFEDGFLQFEEDGDFVIFDTKREVSIPPFNQDTIVSIAGTGEWTFMDEGNMIEILYTFRYQDPYDADVSYSEEAYETWEIKRLSKDEFWLKNETRSLKMDAN